MRTLSPDAPSTAVEALEHHGFSWERLEKLARKALNDRLRNRGQHLDPDRYAEALELYIDVGARWALEYDPGLANGVSFSSSCYRRMYPRLVDYLRARHGDERRGVPLHEVPAGDRTDLVAIGELDEETFEQLIDHVSPGLTRRALATLRTVAYDSLVLGLERWRIAERRGIPAGDISELLEELGWQLRAARSIA